MPAHDGDADYDDTSGELDFITRHFSPLGGAGTHGLQGATNKRYDDRFHADWMKTKNLDEYAKELFPEIAPQTEE